MCFGLKFSQNAHTQNLCVFLANYNTYKNEELIKNAIQELQFPCIIWQIHHSLFFFKNIPESSMNIQLLLLHFKITYDPDHRTKNYHIFCKSKVWSKLYMCTIAFSPGISDYILCTYMSLKSATWHHFTDEKSVFMLWLHRCWALEHAIIFNVFYQWQAMGTVHLALWKNLKPCQIVQIVKINQHVFSTYNHFRFRLDKKGRKKIQNSVLSLKKKYLSQENNEKQGSPLLLKYLHICFP